jgi:hypothetical protein
MTMPDAKSNLVTTVVLSDKSVYVLGVDKELTSVTSKYCIIGGVMYVWRSYDQLARDESTRTIPPFAKASGMTTTPPTATRPGGVVVVGASRQY